MAKQIHFADRMSEADALMWDVESDPALRSTITGVYTLEATPDWDRFMRNLERTTREIPRLRQRVVSDPLGLAPPRWEVDPNFDLGFHVRRVNAPDDGSLRELLDMAQPIGMQAFDRDRPLWELYCVEGLAGGRAGMIFKLHHAVSDGVGLVRMTGGLMERSADPTRRESKPMPPLPQAEHKSDTERTLDAAKDAFATQRKRASAVTSAIGSGLARLVREPREAVQDFSDTVSSIGRLLAPISEPMSTVMRERSLSVHFDTIVVPLADLKRAAKAVGGTVNDAFVGAVTGGLRKYHEELGEPVDELRMNMPINMRSGENETDAGNQFAPVRFAVPVGIADPAKRMRRIHQLVEKQREEPALPLMEGISAAMSALPAKGNVRIAASMLKAIDFTTSNVPGPSFPVYVSGARIEHMFGFGPLAGAAANITCFSYDGDLAISVNVDPAAVRNPELFMEAMKKGIDEVLAVV